MARISGTRLGVYMVAPDGQRFLLYITAAPPITAPLSVIVNWKPPAE